MSCQHVIQSAGHLAKQRTLGGAAAMQYDGSLTQLQWRRHNAFGGKWQCTAAVQSGAARAARVQVRLRDSLTRPWGGLCASIIVAGRDNSTSGTHNIEPVEHRRARPRARHLQFRAVVSLF